MAECLVPNCFIRQLCYPRGVHLLKKELLKETKPVAYNPTSIIVPPRVSGISREGNLPYNDYKYFAGNQFKHISLAHCRWCWDTCYTDIARKNHDKEGCKHWIDVLSEWLKRDGNCLGCNQRTKRLIWGIPICSDSCEDVFKFSNTRIYNMEKTTVSKLQKGQQVGHVRV